MNQSHEYALLGGINRTKVGRYLALASASISAVIVFLLLTLIDIAHRFGLPANLPPEVLSLVGAGSVFSILYWILDGYAWRWSALSLWLKVPNLAGDWECEGRTLAHDGRVQFEWQGVITIIQTWDKIRVRLKTAQSASNSVSAALVPDDIDGCTLLYHYENDPVIEEPQLRAHRGFAQITFSRDLKSGHGEYFNGQGRNTAGRLQLKKRA